MRAHIDVSEIEAQTKIRAKYLRALENEEWGLLPGPTFIKSFLRTYAKALGVDGKALVEEYRLHHEPLGDTTIEPIVPSAQRKPGSARPSGSSSRGYLAVIGVVLLVIVLLIVGIVTGTGGSSSKSTNSRPSTVGAEGVPAAKHTDHRATATPSKSALVALSLRVTGADYVCLIGDGGRRLIPGTTLAAGAITPTYHARRFEIALGNNAVTMYVDGTPRTVPPSSRAIGYAITRSTGRRPLAAGQLPTCS